MIPLTTDSQWLQNVKDAIRIQERKEIWMSETKVGLKFAEAPLFLPSCNNSFIMSNQ